MEEVGITGVEGLLLVNTETFLLVDEGTLLDVETFFVDETFVDEEILVDKTDLVLEETLAEVEVDVFLVVVVFEDVLLVVEVFEEVLGMTQSQSFIKSLAEYLWNGEVVLGLHPCQ